MTLFSPNSDLILSSFIDTHSWEPVEMLTKIPFKAQSLHMECYFLFFLD